MNNDIQHTKQQERPPVRLGIIGLSALTFGLMVGAGIFDVPQNMAASAGAMASLCAWGLTAVAMLLLVYTFRRLALRHPELNSGIYRYAASGFGPFAGYCMMWGYWLCTCFANVAFGVMLNDALGAFIPALATHRWPTFVFCTAMIWGYYLVVASGMKTAKVLTVILGLLKFVTLALIVAVLAIGFSPQVFSPNLYWGNVTLSNIWEQANGCVMVTLWCFIGIEGSAMMSARAKRPRDIGRSAVIGFAGAWILYVLISLLSYGIMPRATLAGAPNPSTATVLQAAAGSWAYWLVIISVIISLVGGWVAWTLVCAEVPFTAAGTGMLPKRFLRLNRHGMPAYGLAVSSVVMQLFLMLMMRSDHMYLEALNITSMMILPCYLTSGLFLAKIEKGTARTLGAVTALFCLWMIYAGGLWLLLQTAVFYLVGLPFFIWARNENHQKVFTYKEALAVCCLCAAACLGFML